MELLALSRLLNRPIEVRDKPGGGEGGGEGRLLLLSLQVIQAEGPSMVMGEDIRGQTSLILTYHRHMFGLGEHYNSVSVL